MGARRKLAATQRRRADFHVIRRVERWRRRTLKIDILRRDVCSLHLVVKRYGGAARLRHGKHREIREQTTDLHRFDLGEERTNQAAAMREGSDSSRLNLLTWPNAAA